MKICIIYHNRDLDGWMSAAIVKHWFESDMPKVESWHEAPAEGVKNQVLKIIRGESYVLDFLGWDYGDNVPDLSEYDKVIMCDISFSKDIMRTLHHDFNYSTQTNNFIVIDHHKSFIEQVEKDSFYGLLDTNYAACELTWKYFFPNETMPEIVRLLGRYDCFGHKGTNEEQKVLEFQYGARQAISNYEEAYNWLIRDMKSDKTGNRNDMNLNVVCHNIWSNGMIIYQYLCTEAKQTYKKAFPVTFIEAKEVFSSLQYHKRKFLCVNQERFNPINFGIDYHKDGYDGFACFWYQNGEWTFSLYNDNGKVDCSAIAKQYGGGGHKGAAGFRVKDIYGHGFIK
jgi:oligoribonuclease NrnB/cAMP/cGMP phosphodiesterase (DHH superfamily)